MIEAAAERQQSSHRLTPHTHTTHPTLHKPHSKRRAMTRRHPHHHLLLLLLACLSSSTCWAFALPPTPPPPSSSPPPPAWLIEAAVGWASMKGLQMVAPTTKTSNANDPTQYIHLPISLLPSSFPKEAFQDVVAAAPVFNELVDRLSRDKEYLNSALGEVSKSDEFTGRLLKMYNEVYSSGVAASAQPVALGLHRSDYMIDDSTAAGVSGKKRLLQVELNTIASSFGCLASVTADLHRYLLERFFLPSLALQPSSSSPDELQAFLSSYLHNHGLLLPPSTPPSSAAAAAISNLPPNPTLTQLPSALAAAHSYYNNPEAIIVFIVQPGERNLFDQRFLELALWEKYQKQVVRLSLEEVTQRCELKKDALFLDNKHEVAVVYFRAGYTPVDYPSEKAWEARMMIERSAAVKCPTLGYQLAGTKKIQQLLCEPSALGRFLNKEQCGVAQKHFTGLYGLGQEEMKGGEGVSATAVRAAIKNPQAYVLKPQREGGGNNFYEEELKKALETWSPEKLSGHVLMQRIQAPARNAYLMREGKVVMGPAVSELGIFSTFLGDTSAAKGGVQVNEYAGFNVRTKLATVNEGGVATGFAVLDSPMLVDE